MNTRMKVTIIEKEHSIEITCCREFAYRTQARLVVAWLRAKGMSPLASDVKIDPDNETWVQVTKAWHPSLMFRDTLKQFADRLDEEIDAAIKEVAWMVHPMRDLLDSITGLQLAMEQRLDRTEREISNLWAVRDDLQDEINALQGRMQKLEPMESSAGKPAEEPEERTYAEVFRNVAFKVAGIRMDTRAPLGDDLIALVEELSSYLETDELVALRNRVRDIILDE